MRPGPPSLAVLPQAQRVLWPSLSQVPTGFVLYGGTALALRLGHRQSVDFDFFTSRPFSPVALQAPCRSWRAGSSARASQTR
jgi:hypothetical protein